MALHFLTDAECDTLQEMVRAWRRGEFGSGGGKDRRTKLERGEGYPFRNDSGLTIPRHGLFFSDSSIDYESLYPLSALQADASFRASWYVNIGDAVEPDRGGSCLGKGTVRLAYDSGTPTTGQGLGPKPSQFTAAVGYPHVATVIDVIDVTNKWVLCDFDGTITRLRGKTNAAIAANASGTINIHNDLASGSSQISSWTVSAFTVAARASGAWVEVIKMNQGWICVGSGTAGKAAWIYFTLPIALTTSQSSKASCTVNDFWGGTDPGETVTVLNMPASSNYAFSGASGNKGIACYDDIEDSYKIVNLECP